jgi:hypothetical protein
MLSVIFGCADSDNFTGRWTGETKASILDGKQLPTRQVTVVVQRDHTFRMQFVAAEFEGQWTADGDVLCLKLRKSIGMPIPERLGMDIRLKLSNETLVPLQASSSHLLPVLHRAGGVK